MNNATELYRLVRKYDALKKLIKSDRFKKLKEIVIILGQHQDKNPKELKALLSSEEVIAIPYSKDLDKYSRRFCIGFLSRVENISETIHSSEKDDLLDDIKYIFSFLQEYDPRDALDSLIQDIERNGFSVILCNEGGEYSDVPELMYQAYLEENKDSKKLQWSDLSDNFKQVIADKYPQLEKKLRSN